MQADQVKAWFSAGRENVHLENSDAKKLRVPFYARRAHLENKAAYLYTEPSFLSVCTPRKQTRSQRSQLNSRCGSMSLGTNTEEIRGLNFWVCVFERASIMSMPRPRKRRFSKFHFWPTRDAETSSICGLYHLPIGTVTNNIRFVSCARCLFCYWGHY